MFTGMADRMTYELEHLAPARAKVKVTAPPERKVKFIFRIIFVDAWRD